MASWTSMENIAQDLYLAQGRQVPVDIYGTKAGEKPPNPDIKEDTEEEFYADCLADGDFGNPNYGGITELLNIVKETNSIRDPLDSEVILKITKLNPEVPEFVPQIHSSKLEKKTKENAIPVALPMLKSSNKTAELKNKIHPSITNSAMKCAVGITLRPGSIFKKRTDSATSTNKNVPTSNSSDKNDNIEIYTDKEYKPSEWAQQYFQKYVQRSTTNNKVKGTIWSQVEKEMKIRDAKLKDESDFTKSHSDNKDTVENIDERKSAVLKYIKLPCHRHDLPEVCRVCQILGKFN